MFNLINRDRANPANDDSGVRLRPLRWSEKLEEVAREHSLDMIRRGYFAHVGPDGHSVINRLETAQIAWQAEGENIAIAQTITQAESEFMNEPRNQENHRWNILNPHYNEVGVGIVRAANGEYYITQDFIATQ